MELVRRQLFLNPGEDLLVTRSALELAERFDAWLQMTGHDPRQVLCTPVVSVPLPVRTARGANDRRWPATTDPTIMWHPLMWLPDRVALRYRLHDENGDEVVEDDTQWSVRVALELTQSGIYDPESGTWLDALSTVGLDIEDEGVQERVRAWLSGQQDDTLDSIDLSPILTLADNREWALEATSDILPILEPATWALLANDLITQAQESTEDIDDVARAIEQTTICTHLALSVLDGVPGAGTEPAPQETWQELLNELDGFTGTCNDVLDGPLETLTNSLYGIRDDYWPAVAALLEDDETGTAGD